MRAFLRDKALENRWMENTYIFIILLSEKEIEILTYLHFKLKPVFCFSRRLSSFQFIDSMHMQTISKYFQSSIFYCSWYGLNDFFNDVLSIMVPIPFANGKQGLKTHLLFFPQEYSYKHHEALEWIAMNMQPWPGQSYIIFLSVVLQTFYGFSSHETHLYSHSFCFMRNLWAV